MSHKKPLPAPAAPPAGPTAHPARGKSSRPDRPFSDNPRLQADNRWQRTKRYGWNSR